MSANSIVARCVLVIAALTLPNQLSTAQIASVVDRDVFIRELDRFIPDHPGAIMVTYEAVGKRAGITTAGFDSTSGAWFIASQTSCAGRDPVGRYFRADVEDAELSEMQPFFAELVTVANEIPSCYLIAMRSNPEMVVDAQLGSDGVWRVLYNAVDPAEINGRAPWELRVADETGHVLSKRWTVSEDSPTTEFDWDGTTVGLRIQTDSTDRLRTLVDDRSDIIEFEAETVFQRAKAYRILADQKLNALSSGYIQTDEGEWVIDEENQTHAHPFNDPLTRRFRMPLIVGGGLVFLIGVAQLIRKGRAK